MKWVTRERVRIDRVSSAWLIWTFIEPGAEILFVPAGQVMEVAEREGAIPFDMPGVEMGHHGDECSFDAILKAHGPKDDPALQKLAAIIRGADSPNKDLTPESRGLDSISHGFRQLMLPRITTITSRSGASGRCTTASICFAGAMPRTCASPGSGRAQLAMRERQLE
jgi:hypothetical protein